MRNSDWLLATVLMLALMIGVSVVACGGGDDDDDDDDDTIGDETFGTDGYGDAATIDDDDDDFTAGVCTEEDCQAMLTFLDDCQLTCVDENQEPVPCVELQAYCENCTGNWGCNINCFGQNPDNCIDFVSCCIACTL